MDQLNYDETIRRRRLIEPQRNFTNLFEYCFAALIPIIFGFLINSHQFSQPLSLARWAWILWLNSIVLIFSLAIFKHFKSARNINLLFRVEDFAIAENDVIQTIENLGWKISEIGSKYCRAVAPNSSGQNQKVTIILSPSKELLINSLSDDSGFHQRFRFGPSFGSNASNIEAFRKEFEKLHFKHHDQSPPSPTLN